MHIAVEQRPIDKNSDSKRYRCFFWQITIIRIQNNTHATDCTKNAPPIIKRERNCC